MNKKVPFLVNMSGRVYLQMHGELSHALQWLRGIDGNARVLRPDLGRDKSRAKERGQGFATE